MILLSGGPGTGKTLFGLNFLIDGARKGERCCYVSLNEGKQELLRACGKISSLNSASKLVKKNLAIECIPLGGDTNIKKFKEIMDSYPDIDRLVIDNVNKLLMFSDDRNTYRKMLSGIIDRLKGMGSTLLICETNDGKIDSGNNESFECDGVVELSFMELEEVPMRTLTIHKMRYSSFVPRVAHEMIIDAKGLNLKPTKIV